MGYSSIKPNEPNICNAFCIYEAVFLNPEDATYVVFSWDWDVTTELKIPTFNYLSLPNQLQTKRKVGLPSYKASIPCTPAYSTGTGLQGNPWILKRRELETSGKRPISLNGKTKMKKKKYIFLWLLLNIKNGLGGRRRKKLHKKPKALRTS